MDRTQNIMVTGAGGFIGRNLVTHLRQRDDAIIHEVTRETTAEELITFAAQTDVVFHLAGVNRPQDPSEFEENASFTQQLCDAIRHSTNTPRIVMASSIQASLDNPYGNSKRRAEETLQAFGNETNTQASCFRLKNVFGKWCRPNYNSVVATFCHNIANDLPIRINDSNYEVDLVYIDDVIEALVAESATDASTSFFCDDDIPSHKLSLAELAGRIQSFSEMQETLRVPDFSLRFNQQLYATYLSYLDPTKIEYGLTIRSDDRGSLAEFIKSQHFGQIFVSRTKPGITRGNHYHHTKTEKFAVLEGEAIIALRHIDSDEVVRHHVVGSEYRVVDIPPGYTHSITNVGDSEMVTLFWASEVFDPDNPDTYYVPVEPADLPVVEASEVAR